MPVVSLSVTYVDGRQAEARITPRAEIEWERHFDKSVTAAGQRQEWMYWLAWKSLELASKETRSFDDWADAIVSVDLADGPDPALDPTQPTPSPPDSSG